MPNGDNAAYGCFCRAVDLHHVYALFMKGRMLSSGWGVAQDQEASNICMLAAAEAGCKDAYGYAGWVYIHAQNVPHDYFKAAVWYIKSGRHVKDLSEVMGPNFYERCPWGRWTADPLIQQLVLPDVRKAMRIGLLLCKRLGVDKNVARIIVSYICTRPVTE